MSWFPHYFGTAFYWCKIYFLHFKKKMCLNSSTSQDFDWCRLMWLQTVRLTSHSKEILEIIPAFNFLFALLLYASQGLAFKCAHAHLCVQHIQYILYMLLRHFAIKKKLGKKRKKEEVALHNLLKKKKKNIRWKAVKQKSTVKQQNFVSLG